MIMLITNERRSSSVWESYRKWAYRHNMSWCCCNVYYLMSEYDMFMNQCDFIFYRVNTLAPGLLDACMQWLP
jgi:hypothetical protein